MYARVADNKRAETLLEAYLQAVAAFGRPLRVRADMCLEAAAIGQNIMEHRRHGAFIAGPSTSNTVRFCAGFACSRGCMHAMKHALAAQHHGLHAHQPGRHQQCAHEPACPRSSSPLRVFYVLPARRR